MWEEPSQRQDLATARSCLTATAAAAAGKYFILPRLLRVHLGTAAATAAAASAVAATVIALVLLLQMQLLPLLLLLLLLPTVSTATAAAAAISLNSSVAPCCCCCSKYKSSSTHVQADVTSPGVVTCPAGCFQLAYYSFQLYGHYRSLSLKVCKPYISFYSLFFLIFRQFSSFLVHSRDNMVRRVKTFSVGPIAAKLAENPQNYILIWRFELGLFTMRIKTMEPAIGLNVVHDREQSKLTSIQLAAEACQL